MTKIKNTKKGMAKKTLSMSLVVAMLATSNVPVWAAEFSDGTDAVATEAPATFSDDAPVVEDNTEDTSAASVVNSGDVTTNLKVDKKSVVWATNTSGKEATVSGAITATNDAALGSLAYRWVDENNVVPTGLQGDLTVTSGVITDIKLAPVQALAGKTLTLYIYTKDGNTDAQFDINTGISVTVEKQDLKSITLDSALTPVYNGFTQSVDLSNINKITVNGGENTSISTTTVSGTTTSNVGKYFNLTSTSGLNAGDELTVTASADAIPDSPYKGSVSCPVKIAAKSFETGDIVADVAAGLEYQYTGKAITIPNDKITLKESKKETEDDNKLGGADLSAAIKDATIAEANATPGNKEVTVNANTEKLKNFKQKTKKVNNTEVPDTPEFNGTFTTTEKVTIKKRDLSTKGTKIEMKYSNVPAKTTVDKLADFLKFTGAEGTELNLKHTGTTATDDYTIQVTKTEGSNGSAGSAVDTLTEAGTYNVVISGNDTKTGGPTCTGSQTLQVTVSGDNVIQSATYTNTSYKPYYTGSEVKPTKADLGNLQLTYIDKDGNPITPSIAIQPSEYEIVGYNNNINATVYTKADNGVKYYPVGDDRNNNIKSQASVTIKLTGSTAKGSTVTVPFKILPLEVKAEYIKVPATISYNKGYTNAEEYKVPVTVVAKDKDGKNPITLDAKDFTVKYNYTNANDTNEIGKKIKSTVTITNTNYILGSDEATKMDVTDTNSLLVTKIAAKALTDSMVVANPNTYTYTGGKITPKYYVIDGTTVLYKKGAVANNVDPEYEEVSITDAVEVGTGKIKVRGLKGTDNKSGYSGEATGTFTITPANTSDVKVEFTEKNECKYTGEQVRPRKFKVTLNGNDVTDQFVPVSYGENISGKGTVVLKPVDGNKNFTGANITAEFNIVKEEVKANLKAYDEKGFEASDWYAKADASNVTDNKGTVSINATKAFEFDGTAHTFAKVLLSNIEKVTDDGVKTTAKASDFEIKYVDNVAGKPVDGLHNVGYVYAVAKDGTGFSGAITLVTADGTIIKNVVAYKAFSIESVKFVAKNVTVKNGTYAAGLPVKPEVTVQIGGTTLVEGKDYKLTLIKKPASSYGKDYLISTKTDVTPTDVTTNKPYGVYIKGINGYEGSSVISMAYNESGAEKLVWGIDKKDIKDCTVTVKDGVATVLNGYLPVDAKEYTAKNNGDGTYTVTANSTSKNYTGSKTVKADGKAEDEKPDAPMISSVKVVGNKATVILSGDSEGAAGYDYVISTDRDCIKNKDYDAVNKNQVQTNTTFKYVGQGQYYAYCHAWKRDENGKKVFSDWSNAYPFVVSAITPDAPVITNVKVSGSTIKVTYKAAANATGYDVVLGTGSKKENGETRPYQYGNHKKLNLKEGTVTATFKKVPKGTWVVGMHAFNRTSEDGKKVFSPWSNLKKATVK